MPLWELPLPRPRQTQSRAHVARAPLEPSPLGQGRSGAARQLGELGWCGVDHGYSARPQLEESPALTLWDLAPGGLLNDREVP